MHNEFDPANITKDDMKLLADHIEDYIMVLEEVMVIPKGIMESRENVSHAIRMVKKLIKKLKAGDKSVFKDYDEWNMLD